MVVMHGAYYTGTELSSMVQGRHVRKRAGQPGSVLCVLGSGLSLSPSCPLSGFQAAWQSFLLQSHRREGHMHAGKKRSPSRHTYMHACRQKAGSVQAVCKGKAKSVQGKDKGQ